jgi:dTDP-4-dehydrorhamnose reductase
VIEHARAAGLPLKVAADAVRPIATSAYPTPAQRPLNSRLDTSRLRSAFGLHLPDWQAGVQRMLTEILNR